MTITDGIHRLTVDDYVHIVNELGWDRTELVDGVVYDVAPVFNRAARTIMAAFRRLDAHLAGDVTYVGATVRVSPFSLFDPAISVLDGSVPLDPDDFAPIAAVKLVVEVSVSTHTRERGAKLIAYAEAGVPEVWLIDPRPEVGELTRYRDPDGASYATIERFAVGEDATDLDVAAILQR